MGQLFPRYADPLFRAALVAGGLLIVGVPTLMMAGERSPYVTQEADPVEQPIPFDHRHHVRDDGIDCLFCHSGAARDEYAGVPSASLCMRCHNQIWNRSELLASVRRSVDTGEPIVWRRVTNLPQYVFFHHGVHVSKGVGCVECHGRVDLMPAVYPTAPMNMSFCLGCHFSPEEHLRPVDRVTDMTFVPTAEDQARVRSERDVRPRTDCSTCHR